jgi:transcriptional regulator with XRE-family HTH domain
MNHSQSKPLGEHIRMLREEADLSVRQLARRVGVHHSYIAYLENGERDNPSNELLERMAETFGIDANELLAHVIKPSSTLPPLRDYFMRKLGVSGDEAETLKNVVEYQLRKEMGEDEAFDKQRDASPD